MPYGNDGGCRQRKGIQIPPIKQNVSDAIKELIYSCLAYDVKERPTAREIVDIVLKKRYSRNKKTIAIRFYCNGPNYQYRGEQRSPIYREYLRISKGNCIS